MATTKSRSTTSRAKTSASNRTTAAKRKASSGTASRSRSSSSSRSQGLMDRASRSISQRPYASAALATGAVTAIAAAAAGAFFFSRTRQEREEWSDDVSTRIKDGLDEARTVAGSLSSKLGSIFGWSSDESRDQAEIAEEALTLKETGKSKNAMLDSTSNQEVKAGAVAY